MTSRAEAGVPAPPVVAVQGIEKTFDKGVRALAPIDLAVAKGAFVTLIGPSGCGKSTLLKLIANLLQPSAGSIAWWQGDFDRVGEIGKRLAFVFQEPTLMPWASVMTNVRLPLDLDRSGRHQGTERARDAIGRVGLGGFEDAYPRQLSGGMRMRVSIARALVTRPDLLLMDEPFGALDEFTRNGLDQDLADLAAERGLTTIFVTHSIYEAVFLSSQVVVMGPRPGRIVQTLDIDEPVPRQSGFRDSPRFLDHCRRLSEWLAAASRPGAGR